jgi:hypothetical protein
MHLRVVVFPQPLGPRSVNNLPGGYYSLADIFNLSTKNLMLENR